MKSKRRSVINIINNLVNCDVSCSWFFSTNLLILKLEYAVCLITGGGWDEINLFPKPLIDTMYIAMDVTLCNKI